MTQSSNMHDLSQVTELKYQIEQEGLSRIAGEERKLRRMLAELDEKERAARTQLADGIALQTIGGDVLWHHWINRNRNMLNARLANVLALKEDAKGRLRLAFGKKSVVERLESDRLKAALYARQKAHEAR